MNKTAIKNYAVAARRKLMEAVRNKAYSLYCFVDGSLPESEAVARLRNDGVFLDNKQLEARRRLCEKLAALGNELDNEKAYAQVLEEVAYTWFNRLIALRFMEVNGFLPSGIRILSSENADRLEPDCIREYERLTFLDSTAADTLKKEGDEKLYRYILLAQCKVLGEIMPRMFNPIADYAALLLPDRLYTKDGIVYDLVHGISEEDFGEQVEIIGWLYQYYISEKKDEVFAALKKNVKITKENIPAATQLFTPDWIVKYMVENSLGRLWIGKESQNKMGLTTWAGGVKSNWKYYIEEADQTDEVLERLNTIRKDTPDLRPEDIKVIDPCMGSGHILVYAFDVLYQIYQSQGYSEREIPDLILQNNLFGLDIDERACQLAYFALMMKARSYNRRFFRGDKVTEPQVYCPKGYADGLEYGSLVKVDELEEKPVLPDVITLFDGNYEEKLNAWNFRRLLSQKYDVVVTNPPYMGSSGMGGKLSEYVKKHYPDSKSDLFAVFIEKCGEMLKPTGYQAMITQHAWMFLSSYEKLRGKLMSRDIINMAHLGARGFEEISGEVVQTTAFVLSARRVDGYLGTYARLVDGASQQAKEADFLAGANRHVAKKENFEKIPGCPVAYWVSEKVIEHFGVSKFIGDISEPRVGMATANNDRFLRLWFEVENNKIYLTAHDRSEAENSQKKWFPITKGGENRFWYGNNETLVNWENDGYDIRNFADESTGRIRSHNYNLDYIFQAALTWTVIGTDKTSFRFTPTGFLYSNSGYGLFCSNELYLYALLGLLNSKISSLLLGILSPSMGFESGYIRKIPFDVNACVSSSVGNIVAQNIDLSRTDWDSFETSWDFKRHPLIGREDRYYASWENDGQIYNHDEMDKVPWKHLIELAYQSWETECNNRFVTLKANEEELNRIFIDIYGLQDELTPEVEDKDVTVRKADLQREIKSFISYAVGCMLGRYSLYKDGLFYAGGHWDYGSKVDLLSDLAREGDFEHWNPSSLFLPDRDNIIPITDQDYFDDDIVIKFIRFVKHVYGDETLSANLDYIANALYPTGGGTSRDKIRRYFMNDFYKDHIKTYQKKPIYWLFDSGKEGGFKALIYLHRYDKYTAARARTDYLHPLQRKYEAEIERLKMLSELPETTAREKAEYQKQSESIKKKIAECRSYDQIIAHIANQNIELDLDDGVTVNYAKFQGVEVPQGDGRGVMKMDLLAKI